MLSLPRLLRRVLRHHDGEQLPQMILHYDPSSRELQPWLWPVSRDWTRIIPANLLAHRITHDFRAPCCLCAADDSAEGGYEESAIYVATSGRFRNQYVAGCASGSCGYLIGMEHLYLNSGLLLKKYPVRGLQAVAPPPILYIPAQALNGPLVIPTLERPPRRIQSTTDQLFRLDGVERPGLSETEFMNLFAKCPCGLIMTRRTYGAHLCADAAAAAVVQNAPAIVQNAPAVVQNAPAVVQNAPAVVQNAPVVIDLTSDGDSDTVVSLSDSEPDSDDSEM